MDVHEVRLRNLKLLMEENALSRKALAAKLETDYGQVGHWFMQKGADGYRNIGTRKSREIEDAFDKPSGWMDRPQWLEPGEPRPTLTRDVPVVGFAIATPDEDGHFEDMGYPAGAGFAYVTWETADRDAHGLEVKGDSMAPRVRPTELLVVEPHAPISPGDEVVVRTIAGRRMFKQFLYERGGEITLGSVNLAYKPISIPRADIESIHRATPARGARTRE